jgi:hypothetical protein
MTELCKESTIKPRTTTIYNREYMREYRKKNKEANAKQAMKDRAKYLKSDKFLEGERKYLDCRCGYLHRRGNIFVHQNSKKCIEASEDYDWLSSEDGGNGHPLLALLTPLNDIKRDRWIKIFNPADREGDQFIYLTSLNEQERLEVGWANQYEGRTMDLNAWISPVSFDTIIIKRLPKLDLATCFIEEEEV